MQATLIIQPSSVSLRCPFCEYDHEENLKFEYCTMPMLWCEMCGARSVLKLKSSIKEFDEGEHSVELYKILKVVNWELCYYKCVKEVSQEEIRAFIESGYDLNYTDGISKVKKVFIDDVDDVDFRVGVECNSYNANAPQKPYPKFFETSHDEDSYIFLECEEGVKMCYWGL